MEVRGRRGRGQLASFRCVGEKEGYMFMEKKEREPKKEW